MDLKQPSVDIWKKYTDTLVNTVKLDEIQRKLNEKDSKGNHFLRKFHKDYSAMDEIQQRYGLGLFQAIETALAGKKAAVPNKAAETQRKRPISSATGDTISLFRIVNTAVVGVLTRHV